MLEDGSVAKYVLAVWVRWGCRLGLGPHQGGHCLHEHRHLLLQERSLLRILSLQLRRLLQVMLVLSIKHLRNRGHVHQGRWRCWILVAGPLVVPVLLGSVSVTCWEAVVRWSELSVVWGLMVWGSGVFATVL